ncbi:rhodanese-like domain-containing protein [Hyalangium sp.]|uniref:rhodanese-like domain-containing protein n=1 Tax=Hyalangium sp. TaxID=2028555 RepID=UPI002D539740|nr:rhodanese-like domain-containing protein [Hyalangium sp.]HYI00748.1 rhodanese-like domain-containing protein [Hyalangium sp.]
MKILLAVVALLGAVLLVSQLVFRSRGAVARRWVAQEGALLLDVRSENEFAAGHLPGAVNVPVTQLSTQLGTLGDKGRPIVVYCASGMRSTRASSLLRDAGFSRVLNLGGMSAW